MSSVSSLAGLLEESMLQNEGVIYGHQNLTVDNNRDEAHKVPGGIQKVDGEALLHVVWEKRIQSLLHKGGRRKF